MGLFEATDCRVILAPLAPRSMVLQRILDTQKLRILDSPSLEELLSRNYAHYQYHKIFAEARHEPLLVVHTSGTTATPKPITYSHDFAASYIQSCQLASPPDYESQVSLCQSNRHFVSLPFFHVSPLICWRLE